MDIAFCFHFAVLQSAFVQFYPQTDEVSGSVFVVAMKEELTSKMACL